jgi:Rad3-related DNA helicase
MFNSQQVWKHDFNYEKCLDSYGRINRKAMLDLYQSGSEYKNPGAWLLHELASGSPKYIFRPDTELYRGEMKDVLRAEPVDIRGLDNPVFNTGNKLVLMSATIGRNDIIELGLDKRRVFYHEAESCIPAERRPIYFEPVGKIRGQDLTLTTPLIGQKITELMDKYPLKGLIHATYAQARALRSIFSDHPRVMFHDKTDKTQRYQEFRADTTDKVLIASGLYEGVDLPDDMGRWQALAKVPWPNKGEPAIAYAADLDPNWYTWNTAKQVMQACGRISRHPEDQGDTYILDSTFKSLYNNNDSYWPRWWRESLHGI